VTVLLSMLVKLTVATPPVVKVSGVVAVIRRLLEVSIVPVAAAAMVTALFVVAAPVHTRVSTDVPFALSRVR
jgi:hypothetical protein